MCPLFSGPRPQTRAGPQANQQDLDNTLGDYIPPKNQQNDLRIFGMNIEGFSNSHQDRIFFLQHHIQTYQPDIICISETSLLWHKIPAEKRLDQKMRDFWPGTKTFWAYNTHDDSTATSLPGGVAIIIKGPRADGVIQHGRDSTGLGRWVWVRLRGFQGTSFTIVSAYRPVKNQRDDRSTYVQHEIFFKTQFPPRSTCPREAFLQDLTIQLNIFHEQGDHIVVSMDANEPLLFRPDNPVERAFSEIQLKEMILNKHDRNQAPSTFERGSKPIDGLFTSSELLGNPCGYLSFNDSPGDHRVLWTDIPSQLIFGESARAASAPSNAKRLKCQDPRSIKKFHKVLYPLIIKHKLVERAVDLERSISDSTPLSPIQQKEWEDIDQIRVKSYIAAEKKCRRLHTGTICWTPQYQRAVSTHRFWHLMLRKLSGKKVGSRYLNRWAQRASLVHELQATLQHATEQKELAWSSLKQARKRSQGARSGWLASLAQARSEAGLESAKKALTVMQTRENQRRNSRIIKNALSDTSRTSLREVKAPHLGEWVNGEWIGTWKSVTKKEDMEQEGLQETNRRFRQADTTPLLSPTIRDITGPFGCSISCHDLLHHNDISPFEPFAEPPTLEYLQSHYTPSLATRRGIFSMHISTDQHIAAWLHADETTTCGPSGLLFSHLIANAHDRYLATLDATMTSIPAQTGFSPNRWRMALNVMIPKKADDPRVTKLRTILLYEADFNMMNKVLGRRLMECAEFNNRIAIEQYGSRKGHSSIDQSLNKRLTFDFARQTLTRSGIISNDAKSCYDRIVHSAAGIAMQRGGAPASSIICMFDTIQNLRHYIRTAHGDSTTFLPANSMIIPIQGVGQGNGAGPTIWAVVSTPIFDAMRRRGYGIYIRSALSDHTFLLVGYAFVDDTDLAISDDPSVPPPTSLFDRIQKGVSFWEESLRVSGGAIAPDKSFWYLIDFKWTNGDWQYVKPLPSDPPLKVRDPYGKVLPIPQLDPAKGDLTLGIKLAPDGNNHDEFEYLQQKVQNWVEKIRTKKLPRHLVWQSLTTGIFRSLIYPLAATTFSRTECKKLTSPLLQVGLSFSGIDRSIARDIVHAPLSRGGLGLPDIFVEQGISHISRLIRYGNSTRYITGYLLRAGIESLTLELGLPGRPFDHPYQEWKGIFTQCWVSCSWKFQSLYQLRIVADTPTIPLLRNGDQYLTALFSSSKFSTQQRKRLNYCRQFLRAVTISDITNVEGTRILPFAWNGTGNSQHRLHYRWNRTPPSSKLDWALWRTALTSTMGISDRFNYLQTPLGTWHTDTFSSGWFWSRESGRLLRQQKHNQWEVFQSAPSRTTRLRFHKQVLTTGDNTLRQHYEPLFRVDVAQQGSFWCIDSQLEAPTQFPMENQPTDDNCLSWCAGTWFTPPTPRTLIALRQAILAGTFEGLSDGSFRDGEGSAAWCISTPDHLELISAGLRVPGDTSCQSPYRSELAGIFAMVRFILFLVEETNIQEGGATLGCDGLSVLQRLSNSSREATTTDSNWDLLSGLLSMLHKMPGIQIKWQHVRGHQDEKRMGPFDQWTTRNILMDVRADLVWEEVSPLPTTTPIPFSYWPLFKDATPISTDLSDALREHCNGPRGEAYWIKHQKLNVSPAPHVAWSELGDAMRESTTKRRHWITKHSAKRCAVGRVMLRRKLWNHSKCPRCGEDNETTTHVFRCRFPEAQQLWLDSISNLETWLRSKNTHPAVTRVICLRLQQWHDGNDLIPIHSSIPGLADVIRTQDSIGWEAAVEGKWAKGWHEIQSQYYVWKGRRNTGKRWLVAVIKRLWDIAWDLWNHRNTVRLAEEQAETKKQVRQAISEQFLAGYRDLISNEFHLLQSQPLATRLAAPLSRQQQWLRRIKACRARGATLRFQRHRQRSQSLLRQWLLTATAP